MADNEQPRPAEKVRARASDPVRVGGRLPALRLPDVTGNLRVNVRGDGRHGIILVGLDASELERFRPYLDRLSDALPAFRVWDGHVLVVLRAAAALAADSAAWPFPLLRDESDDTAGWAPRGEALVVVADRYGDVYHVVTGRSPAQLTDTVELEEWLRYLATQCPECGVPDEPRLGEWAP